MEYEEISLKELIIILIKGWKWIVSVTLITTLAAIVFTLGFKPVLYESNSSFNIILPSSVETQFGTYNFPSTNVNDYISLLTSDSVINGINDELKSDINLREALTYTYDATKNINTVNTKVTLEDPKLATEIHQIWLEKFVETLEESYQQIAIEQLIANLKNKSASLISEQESIRTQLTVLKTFKESLNYTKGVSVDESADNYLYYQVITNIMNLELRDYEISTTLVLYDQDIDDLEAISVLNQRNHELNVLNGAITLPTKIIEPTTSIDRGLMLNTAIGFVLGGMLGVFIVFFLNYWKSEPIN